MLERLKIVLPLPFGKLSINDKSHWRVKAPRIKAARERARLATLDALQGGIVTKTATAFGVTWYKAGKRRPDVDNIASLCKAYIDGMCDALCVNDRQFTRCTYEIADIKDKAQECVVIDLHCIVEKGEENHG